ncbi:MAG: RtcB family protein, partial [Bacillota bacterium]|nr:RtcB family protein [Bacillota bacterium]
MPPKTLEQLHDVAQRAAMAALMADAPEDHPLFRSPAWDGLPKRERESLREEARRQLGTVGGGNHGVEVFAAESAASSKGPFFPPSMGRPGHGAAPRPTEGREATQRWLREKGIILRGGDVDEAPQVYR